MVVCVHLGEGGTSAVGLKNSRFNPKLPKLTREVRAIVDGFAAVLGRTAQRQQIPVVSVEVSRFMDPEDDSEALVLTQWVDAEPKVALDYWEVLGGDIEGWIDSLPGELKRIASDCVAINMRRDKRA